MIRNLALVSGLAALVGCYGSGNKNPVEYNPPSPSRQETIGIEDQEKRRCIRMVDALAEPLHEIVRKDIVIETFFGTEKDGTPITYCLNPHLW